MTTEDAQMVPAPLGPVERMVRPYATSVTWRNAEGGSWQQWHDDDDPMPAEWGDRPPDEVVHVYTAAQVAELLAAERERWKEAAMLTGDALRELERYEYAAATIGLRKAVASMGPNGGIEARP